MMKMVRYAHFPPYIEAPKKQPRDAWPAVLENFMQAPRTNPEQHTVLPTETF